jgi:uncharacterized membrane protein YozB (DUF420 family)
VLILVGNPFLKHFKVNNVALILISAYGCAVLTTSGNRLTAYFILVFMALWIPGGALGADSVTKASASVKTPAQATPPPVLETATVGIYIMNTRDMSPARGTFSCDFWIWAKTTSQENILADLQFLNAEKVIWYTETKPEIMGLTCYKRRGTGTFRMNWNLKHYPYDSQVLPIQMEYSLRDSSKVILKPDTENSGINRENIPPDWSVREFTLKSETSIYTSNLGDPALGQAKGSFSLLTAVIDMTRHDSQEYWSLVSIAYVAVVMMLVSYFTDVHTPQRLTLLGAALFANIISMRSAFLGLGTFGTLADQFHLMVAAFIVLSLAITVLFTVWCHKGDDHKKLRNWSMMIGVAVAILFAACNVWLVRSH